MQKSNCLHCNIKFIYRKHSSTGKFCSNACSGLHKVFLSKQKIEEGIVREATTLKRYLKDTRGYKCEDCNNYEWNGKPLSLHLDHIDGNSDNNFPNNIRLLCPNCHSQTETFSGRNKKNTKRNSYMQRYRITKLVGGEGIEPPTDAV